MLNADNYPDENGSEDLKYRSIDCQTISTELFGIKTFKRFEINFGELKKENNYVIPEIDNINIGDPKLTTLLTDQLSVRDKLIDLYERTLKNAVNHGTSLEIDIEYLKLKVEKLDEQNRKLREEMANIQKDVNKTSSGEDYQPMADSCEIDNSCSKTYEYPEDYSTNINLSLQLDTKLNLDENQGEKEVNSSAACDNTWNSAGVNVDDKPWNSASVNVDDKPWNSASVNVDDNSWNSASVNVDDKPWNSVNIIEEVKAIASEVIHSSGYVYIEEYGMYYDYSSGYYYDPNTSLYCDCKSGMYFYYDHEKQEYQFHSQVGETEKSISSNYEKKKKDKKPIIKIEKELEDGECSDSSHSSHECEEMESETVVNETSIESFLPNIAPSLRLMVTSGNTRGNLHIVTVSGGTVGREKDNIVSLRDLSVSKVHAQIWYRSDGPDDHHYYIKDIGSNNGTYVRGVRLSKPRTESEEVELGHGWDIQCGEVCLSCHIHPGHLTCNSCEPGLVQEHSLSEKKAKPEPKEKERRRQNNCIRKKYALNWHDDLAPRKSAYRDRASKRREVIGSDNPYEKTEVSSIDLNLPKHNKGFKLLEKMGWAEGQGLGLKQDGIVQPVIPVATSGRTGLGAFPDSSSLLDFPLLPNSKDKISLINFAPASKNPT